MGFLGPQNVGAAPQAGYGTPAPRAAPAPGREDPLAGQTGWSTGGSAGGGRVGSGGVIQPAPAPRVTFGGGGRFAAPAGWSPPAAQTFSAAPVDNSGGGGGATMQVPPSFDFTTDPGYMMALSNQQMGNTQLDAALKSQREQAIINFGDPSLASMAGFGMDPQAAAFAQQNYISGNSTLSKLDKAHKDARTAVINHLAGTGLLFSGDTGYQGGQADSTYGHNVYDARHAVLDALTGMANQNMAGKQANNNQLTQALMAAYQNYASQIGQGGYYGGSYGPGGGDTGAGGAAGGGTSLGNAIKAVSRKAAPAPGNRATMTKALNARGAALNAAYGR
jgi:hypothetical protein